MISALFITSHLWVHYAWNKLWGDRGDSGDPWGRSYSLNRVMPKMMRSGRLGRLGCFELGRVRLVGQIAGKSVDWFACYCTNQLASRSVKYWFWILNVSFFFFPQWEEYGVFVEFGGGDEKVGARCRRRPLVRPGENGSRQDQMPINDFFLSFVSSSSTD